MAIPYPVMALIAAWGLVSKDHLVLSRSHIFSSVHLDSANAHEFANILAAPSCDIPPLIQKLVLSNRLSGPVWFPHVSPPPPGILECHRTFSPQLEIGPDPRHPGPDPPTSSGRHHFGIVNFSFAYRTDAIEFACGFTRLEELTFFPKIKHNLAPATSVRIPPALRRLAVRCSSEEQPNWFLADVAPPVSEVRIREAGARDFSAIAGVLTRLGDSLESFAVDFSDTVVEVAFLRNSFFEANTALQRLELTLGGTTMVELCITFLSRLASPVLEELVLDIWVDPAQFMAHRWEALDATIVQGPAGATMRRVELRIGTLITWDPLALNIRARMPLCDRLGVLRVPSVIQ
ncbi:hypothetical protein B0H17DRAFT_1212411 [Mycena rosella]|uniref:Uncharacterized protein n=1 Tax=Mycena rosella TaxID=1033263 RepID=A0AAD7CSL0_MYCRO|nr:hypothetical protein B0H17DRAFT_1212411 [Mycena rosella]